MITARSIFADFARRHVPGIGLVFAAGLFARLIAILVPLVIGRYCALRFGYASLRAKALAWMPDEWLLQGNAFLLSMLLLVSAWFLFRYIERYYTSLLGEWLVQSLRESLFKRQLEASPKAFAQRTTGKYLLRYSGDLKQIQNLFNLGIMAFVRDLLVVVPACVLFSWLLPDLALPAMIAFLTLLLPLAFLNRRLYRASVMRRDRRSGLLAFVTERLLRHSAIQALNRSRVENKKFRKRSQKLALAGKRYFKIESFVRTLIPTLVYLVPGFLFLWIEWGSGHSQVNPESLSLAALLLIAIAPVFRRIARVTVHWELGKLSMRKLLVVMNQERAEEAGLLDLETVDGHLSCVDLSFQFEDGPPLFEHFQMELEGNGLVWVRGGTGSGKTVLVKLLLQVLRPQEGQVLIDGQPLEGYSLKSVRKQMAVVSDAWPLLGKTVFEAITYSRKAERRPRATAMLERVQAGMPGWNRLELDDVIGDLGSRLSSGQATLLQFARAFLTRKPILLLDEPFQHLDEDSQENLVKMIKKLKSKRNILILSTHAPLPALEVDRVIRLDGPTGSKKTIPLRNMG